MGRRRDGIRMLVAWLCLLVGMGIYVLFRSRQHLGFVVADAAGLGTVVDGLRACVAGVTPPEWVRFSLPDGLWTASYILFTDHVFRMEPLRVRTVWVSVIPLVGVVSEMMQMAGWMPGVFDVMDMVAYVVPWVIWKETHL